MSAARPPEDARFAGVAEATSVRLARPPEVARTAQAPPVRADRLPLTVIGGFLGAGKTTLLNHWLREADGQRLAVLVNDFGALNIDAELIAGNSGDTIALTNGCVCCQIGDDLSMALIGVLEQRERFDAVVIEASGVSDPWRIAQLGRADPGLALDGVVVLVDASAVLALVRDPLLTDTLERQLPHADLVVVNKTDLVDAPSLAQVHAWIHTHAPGARQFDTVQATVPPALLSGAALLRTAPAPSLTPYTQAHGSMFATWSARPQGLLQEAALRDWLAAVPPGVLRLKGFVQTDDLQWWELQFAGRAGNMRRAAPRRVGAALVAIGLRGQLPVDTLNKLAGPVA